MSDDAFIDTVRELISDVREALGLTSNSEVASRIEIKDQTLSNVLGRGKSRRPGFMLSKPKLDQLVELAGWDQEKRDAFDAEWLEFKLRYSGDGGVGSYLLGILRSMKKKPTQADIEDIVRKCAELRHGADISGRKK